MTRQILIGNIVRQTTILIAQLAVQGIPLCGLASECLPSSVRVGQPLPVSCNGAEVTFCDAGLVETVDCLDLGCTGRDDTRPSGGCTPGSEL